VLQSLLSESTLLTGLYDEFSEAIYEGAVQTMLHAFSGQQVQRRSKHDKAVQYWNYEDLGLDFVTGVWYYLCFVFH
jgi:hypothetical protein